MGAGAVLGDLVRGYAGRAGSPVVELTTNFRSEADIKALAAALRGPVGGQPDPDAVLEVLRTASDQVSFVEASTEDDLVTALRPTAVAAALLDAASAPRPRTRVGALEALDRHRLLCAHREGPFGVRRWNALVERWLAEESGPSRSDCSAGGTSAGRCS